MLAEGGERAEEGDVLCGAGERAERGEKFEAITDL